MPARHTDRRVRELQDATAAVKARAMRQVAEHVVAQSTPLWVQYQVRVQTLRYTTGHALTVTCRIEVRAELTKEHTYGPWERITVKRAFAILEATDD